MKAVKKNGNGPTDEPSVVAKHFFFHNLHLGNQGGHQTFHAKQGPLSWGRGSSISSVQNEYNTSNTIPYHTNIPEHVPALQLKNVPSYRESDFPLHLVLQHWPTLPPNQQSPESSADTAVWFWRKTASCSYDASIEGNSALFDTGSCSIMFNMFVLKAPCFHSLVSRKYLLKIQLDEQKARQKKSEYASQIWKSPAEDMVKLTWSNTQSNHVKSQAPRRAVQCVWHPRRRQPSRNSHGLWKAPWHTNRKPNFGKQPTSSRCEQKGYKKHRSCKPFWEIYLSPTAIINGDGYITMVQWLVQW